MSNNPITKQKIRNTAVTTITTALALTLAACSTVSTLREKDPRIVKIYKSTPYIDLAECTASRMAESPEGFAIRYLPDRKNKRASISSYADSYAVWDAQFISIGAQSTRLEIRQVATLNPMTEQNSDIVKAANKCAAQGG